MSERNTVTKNEQIAEAIDRLTTIRKLYNTVPDILRDFKEGVVHKSEYTGLLYWTHDDPKCQQEIEAFEKKTGSVVYHVVRTQLEFGLCDSFLFVSKYKEEWGRDREALTEGYPFVYVANYDDPWCSEFGSIGIKGSLGGLKRIS